MWPRRAQDPAPGACDNGTFVECCTNDAGLTSCEITRLGYFSPAARAYLAWITPTDSSEGGTLARVGEFIAENSPGALVGDVAAEARQTVADVAGNLDVRPQINVQADNLALVMAVLGAGALYVWSRSK